MNTQAVPVAITELTRMLDRPEPNYGEMIYAATEMLIARTVTREHHLRLLVVLGRSHLARNKGDDLQLALRRFMQAHELAEAIGVPELIFRVGCRYAEAIARNGNLKLAKELLVEMEVRFLKGDDPRQDPPSPRRRFWRAQATLVAASKTTIAA